MNPLRSERIYERQAQVLASLLEQANLTVQAGQPLDTLVSRFYHEHPEFGSRDRRLFSGTLFSYFRWKGWLDIVAPELKSAAVFAHLLEVTEIHPAIAKLAALCRFPDTTLLPLGAMTLEEKARLLGDNTGHRLAINQLIPAWAIPILPTGNPFLVASFQQSPPTWLRLKSGAHPSTLTHLNNLNTTPAVHPVIQSAVAVTRGLNLRSLPRSIREQIEIQDLASQATTLVCNPKPGEYWWDACAGSGGKTLHLAALTGDSAAILATDVRQTILEALKRRLQENGIHSVKLAQWDGMQDVPPQGPFDGILLDAPCSGIGTWHRNPDARWRITEKRVMELADIQSRLLRVCASRLKPGGVLIYATCTMTTVENESVIQHFLETTPDLKLDPFINPLNRITCGGKLQIMPWDGPCNGMFIARLKKIA